MMQTTPPASDSDHALAHWRGGTPGAALVVLLHGVGLRAEAWAALVPELSDVAEVHALDMPGHGASPLAGAAHLADFSERVAGYIAELGRAVHLVGHSMGALITLDIATRGLAPLVSASSLNGIFRRSPQARASVQARAAVMADRAAPDPTAPLARWFGTDPTEALRPAHAACQAMLQGADPVGYKTAYGVFAHSDGPQDAALAALRLPLLCLTGEGDGNSTPAMSQAMARLAPMGRAAVIASAAHMLPMTHPGETAQHLSAHFAAADHPNPNSNTGY